MKTLIMMTAIGLAMMTTPLAADDGAATADGTATTPDYMSQSQGMLPAADRARSYDNTNPATADPQLGPQGGEGEDGGDAGAGAGAGDGGSGEGSAGEGGSGGDSAGAGDSGGGG